MLLLVMPDPSSFCILAWELAGAKSGASEALVAFFDPPPVWRDSQEITLTREKRTITSMIHEDLFGILLLSP
jgi:hypothetical protein